MRRLDRPWTAGVLLAALAVTDGVRADAPRYEVQFIGPTLMVTDLNDDGWAIGQSISGVVVSWVWSAPGGYQMLEPLDGATGTQAYDISDAGVVVGTTGGQPVVWDHVDGVYGSPTELPILPGYTGGRATALNDVGDIVGLSTDGQFQRTTLFTAVGGPEDLGLLGFWPTPAAINDAREVVGHDRHLDLETGVVVQLPVPSGPPSYLWTVAADINDAGQIASQGVLATSQPDDRIPVRYTPGSGWVPVMSLPTPYASATSVNALGDCGISYFKGINLVGEGLFAPGSLLPANEVGWEFGSGFAIAASVIVNDRRQLLTTAWNDALGQSGAVILTPMNLHGDVDGDGNTGFSDLNLVLSRWGTSDAAADCTMDGSVGFADLALLLNEWG